MEITVINNSGEEITLHTIEDSARPYMDQDAEEGTLYDTTEEITVIYNDGSNEYSIAR